MFDETLSVDFDALERGGVRIKDLAKLIESIAGPLLSTIGEYGALDEGGHDPYAVSLRASYNPSAQACEDFIRTLRDLLDLHGYKTGALGGAFDDLNTDTASEASSGSDSAGHRR